MSLFPSESELNVMQTIFRSFQSAGFIPTSVKTPEMGLAIMLKGRELGIPPLQALSGINVIQGKPTISPELMMAMVYKNVPGAIVNFVKTDNQDCELKAKRPGGEFSTFSFTIEDAKAANLLSKNTWSQYPAAMLRARCISAMCRALFPDALAGASYIPEELEDEPKEKMLELESPMISRGPVGVIVEHGSGLDNVVKEVPAQDVPNLAHFKLIVARAGWAFSDVKHLLQEKYGVDSAGSLSGNDYNDLCDIIAKNKAEDALALVRGKKAAADLIERTKINDPDSSFLRAPEASWDDVVKPKGGK